MRWQTLSSIFPLLLLPICHSVRIIDSNSFRSESRAQAQREQKHVESLAIFNSEPRYVDSSEIRSDTPVGDNPGPFFPIQFPAPIKYDQSNAIRYKTIDRTAPSLGDTETEQSTFRLGNVDIGEERSSYVSPLLAMNDVGEYRTPLEDIPEYRTPLVDVKADYKTPLISRTRDIEIYRQESSTASPYSGESVDIEMFDGPSGVSEIELTLSSEEGEDNHPGPINFSTRPRPGQDRAQEVSLPTSSLSNYLESNTLRRPNLDTKRSYQNSGLLDNDRVNFGVLISATEDSYGANCLDMERNDLVRSLKDILHSEFGSEMMRKKTGISLDLTIVDECDRSNVKEAVKDSYILLTNSQVDMADSGAVLNVSTAHKMSQFERALRKVGITKYHHLTERDIIDNDDILDVLRSRDVDTVISDVHGHSLHMLIDKLSGMPERAARYTWIFTSILSSEMLLKIEQLLTRTKVVSIFATADKKLLHQAVKVKDNAAQISAMETALPYLYMLRQLQTAYMTAWQQLCGQEIGRCGKLSKLSPRQFIQTFFNPSISARRQTPISFMLIVYRSSAVDDYLDMEIPPSGEAEADQVQAVMATVEPDGVTVVPSVVITQTVSTINLTNAGMTIPDPSDEFPLTLSDSTLPITTTEMLTTTEQAIDIVARCRKYNACVVYLIQDTDNEVDVDSILSMETGANRRSGLSVGSAMVPMEMLYDIALPRNTIATITVSEKEAVSMMYPDMYNYNLETLSQQSEDDMSSIKGVARGVNSVLTRLGWSRVVMVMFNSGVTETVTNHVVESGEVCVEQVIHLNTVTYLQSPAYQYLLTLLRDHDNVHMVLVTQTVDQVSQLMLALSTDLGWDIVTGVGRYLIWSYLQTPDHLAGLAEELPPMTMFIMSEAGDQVDTSSGPLGLASRVMDTLGQSLSSYSSRHCPDTSSLLSCVNMFRSYLSRQGGPETMASIGAVAYNLLRLNNAADGVFGDEEPLYVLTGEWDGSRVVMYEDIGGQWSGDSQGQCINTTGDYTAQLVTMIQAKTDSNIQTLWGSIALGICIFGVLIVIISAFYFIIAVNRKQKSEFGSSKDHTRLLHYMIIIGLIILFLSPIPWIIPVNSYTCIARHIAPTLAFSIVLASLLVNLIATFRQTIYTVTPAQVSNCCCSPTLDSAGGLLSIALLLTCVQMIVTGIDIGLHTPTTQQDTCVPGHDTWQWSVATYTWLLLLTLTSVCMSVACLKYDATNRDAKWSLVCLICLTTIWVSWLVVSRLLEEKFKDPVCVMALVVSALLVMVCLYARKLYEYTEFGKADTKLELMSNIMLSDSPTDSQGSGSRHGHYGSAMSILPGIIAMPEEDNSILGESSVYQHLRYEDREAQAQSHVDLKMFEHHQQQHQQQVGGHDITMTDGESQSEYGDWSREDIYQSISRGVGYKPVLKKIGSRHMLVLNNQQTLSKGSSSKI